MVQSSSNTNPGRGVDDPIYLTAAGRKRLEERLASDMAERERLQPVDPTDVRDSGDESDRLEAADQIAQLEDRIDQARAILERALPMPSGPDDGVVRLGTTVSLRDDHAEEFSLLLIDPAELDGADDAVTVNAPVGAAIFGRKAGDQIAVSTPGGDRKFEILSVQAYRPS
jgi:transcription elongation factor GreA